MSLAGYLRQVNQAIGKENGPALCELFKLDGPGLQVAMQATQGGQLFKGEVSRQLNDRGNQAWADIVWSFLQALIALCKGEKLAACEEFRERHAKPLQALVQDQVWVLQPVVGSANTLRVLSAQVDDDALRRGGGASTSTQLSKCAMVLQSLFGKTAAAKGADADVKRAAAVAIGCIMLKVYFRLNTLTNCKNVIQTIEGPLKMFDAAQIAHKVTYRYYTGRLLAYDENYVDAEQHLAFALGNCHPSAVQNKKRILRYLIPVRMLLGILPTDALLQESGLVEYRDIAAAVRAGDARLLMRALETHQVALVQAGTYLLLEKLQLAAYRRLFKKCALLHAEMNPAKATQVPIEMFSAALRLQDIDKDDVELQCLLSNLIYRKFIKGYIAYKQRVVVLAKVDPFPAMATVQLGDPFGS